MSLTPSVLDFLISQSARNEPRVRFDFKGGFVMNRRELSKNDTFMELDEDGSGYIFYVDTDANSGRRCVRLLWTCSDVYERPWARAEAAGANNREFVQKHIRFVYMLNARNKNRQYKFSEPFALWIRQHADPQLLFAFATQTSSAATQTDGPQRKRRKYSTHDLAPCSLPL